MICAPWAAAASTSADTASMLGPTGPGRGSCSAATVMLRVIAALCRKLLARAMEAPAADDDSARVDPDGAAVRKKRRERVDGLGIVLRAIGRDEHNAVADIEVHVARCCNLALDLDAAG